MIRHAVLAILAVAVWAGDALTPELLQRHLASPRSIERAAVLGWAADLGDPALAVIALKSAGEQSDMWYDEWRTIERLVALVPEAELESLARDADGQIAELFARRLAGRGATACAAIATRWAGAGRGEAARKLALAALTVAKSDEAGIGELTDLALGVRAQGSLADTVSRLPTAAWNQALAGALLASPDASVRQASLRGVMALTSTTWTTIPTPEWVLTVVRGVAGSGAAAERALALSRLALVYGPRTAADRQLAESAVAEADAAVRCAGIRLATACRWRPSDDVLLAALASGTRDLQKAVIQQSWSLKPSAVVQLRLDELAKTADPELGFRPQMSVQEATEAERKNVAQMTGASVSTVTAAELAKRIGADIDLPALLVLEPVQRRARLAELFVRLKPAGRQELLNAMAADGDAAAVTDFLAAVASGPDAGAARDAVRRLPVDVKMPLETAQLAAAEAALRLADSPDPELASWARGIVARLPYPSLQPLPMPGVDASEEQVLDWLSKIIYVEPRIEGRTLAPLLRHKSRTVRFRVRAMIGGLSPEALDHEILELLTRFLPPRRSNASRPDLLLARLDAFAQAVPAADFADAKRALQDRIAELAAVTAKRIEAGQATLLRLQNDTAAEAQRAEERERAKQAADQAGAKAQARRDEALRRNGQRMWKTYAQGMAKNDWSRLDVVVEETGANKLKIHPDTKPRAAAFVHFDTARLIKQLDVPIAVVCSAEIEASIAVETDTGTCFESKPVRLAAGERRLACDLANGEWRPWGSHELFAAFDLSGSAIQRVILVISHQGNDVELTIDPAAIPGAVP